MLHPGNMGAALAACLEGETLWASEGRSETTANRARESGIVDLGSLDSLVGDADAVISVCPPAAAFEMAEQVSGLGFDGLYVDVNAVSPATARRVGRLFARFVDGGIVGPPPTSSRRWTRAGRSKLMESGRRETGPMGHASISPVGKPPKWQRGSPDPPSTLV